MCFHWIGKKLSMSTALVMEHFLIGDCEENRLRGKIGFSFLSNFDISDTFSFRRSYILIVTKICNTSKKLLDIRRIFWWITSYDILCDSSSFVCPCWSHYNSRRDRPIIDFKFSLEYYFHLCLYSVKDRS